MTETGPADAPELKIDRGIPEVSSKNRTHLWAIAVLVLLCGAGLIAVNLAGSEEQNAALTAPQEEHFKIESSSPLPVPEPAPPARIPEQEPAKVQPEPDRARLDPVQEQRLFIQQQQDRRHQEEIREMAEARQRSPILLFDGRGGGQNQGNMAGFLPAATGNGLFPGAPRTAGQTELSKEETFLQQKGRANIETVQASRLQNQSALIAQGSMIRGVLESAIQSDLPGYIRAIVSQNIYSFDGSSLLIPEGSRLVGQYQSGVRRGQTRVFIIWTRLLRPDGASVMLGSPGTDNLGRAGLGGDVDTHFIERFGSAVLLSMIDAALEYAVSEAKESGNEDVAVNTGQSFRRSSEIALEDSINIPPTIHVDQGTPIQVFVAKDLDFSTLLALEE